MEIMYVLAISLQVCGAVILLIHSFGNKQQEMNNEINSNIINLTQTFAFIKDIDILNILNKLTGIYLNRTAFISLGLGYFLGIFGEITTTSKWIIALAVVIASFIITPMSYYLCKKLAVVRQKKYKNKYEEEYKGKH